MKAVMFDETGLGNSLVQEFTRFSSDDGDDDEAFYGWSIIAKITATYKAMCQKVLSKKLGAIMRGGGGNGGSTNSTMAGLGNLRISQGSAQTQTGPLHTGDHVNIGTGPIYFGRIDITEYNSVNPGWLSPPHHGVTIRLSYLDNNSGFSEFEWVQTVIRSTDDDNIATETFTDPKNSKAAGHWPFYYTVQDYNDPKFEPPPGYQEYFYDQPCCKDRKKYQFFQAELTLLGVNKENRFVPLITFKYGYYFLPGAHDATPIPLTIVSSYPNGYANLSFNQNWNITHAVPR